MAGDVQTLKTQVAVMDADLDHFKEDFRQFAAVTTARFSSFEAELRETNGQLRQIVTLLTKFGGARAAVVWAGSALIAMSTGAWALFTWVWPHR